MAGRFSNLTKIPTDPAAKLLAQANMKLETRLDAPASASVEDVLSELDAKGANVDLLRLLSIALPPRERVWWACLAARDIVGAGVDNETPSLQASEAWVFRPGDETREKAIASTEHADNDDVTVHCAMAVMYSDGTSGTGDLAQVPAPPGGSSIAAFAMNVEAIATRTDDFDAYIQELIDRAVDIGRGGNGKRKENGEIA
ncbi:hypothetical protein [Marivita sp. XM-24bin2]|jgi:hypothetical protein|uniref:DUF6931 family protein n=1 Tax=unclassified Marivita TaxID=2632480 RepID=UPI000D795E0E|nr:hypothetical protein [Marivita sp. XM-24bin2]MCR9108563.1 hypothetical protein [Paracoccaceae bacterium]PWL36137.1 MAG: hypothetical protein DCO97_05890 [Marivita sp. XM-24bin2]